MGRQRVIHQPERVTSTRDRAAAKASRDFAVDDLDRSILEVLRSDPRSPVASVARKTGVTPATVRRRVERLRRSGVVQFIAAIDPERVGYHVSALIGLQVDLKKTDQIRRALSQLDEITYASAVLGGFDFLLTAVFETEDDLYTFLTQKLAKVDGVQRTETFRVLKVVKRLVSWGVVSDQLTDRRVSKARVK